MFVTDYPRMADMTTAFVLGGGGVLGAAEVGMLRALFEVEVIPDLVLGTSVGALNGAMVARDPTPAVIGRLTDLWQDAETARARLRPAAAHRAAGGVDRHPPVLLGAAAATAASRSSATPPSRTCRSGSRSAPPASSAPPSTGSTSGRLVDAIMASAAVPGLLPPAEVDDEHFLDGGIVNSIPLGRAVSLGADRVFVLQVGRIDRPLTVPTPAVAGRPRLVRDRPAPPVRPRAGRGARPGSRCTCCRPGYVGRRRLAAGAP